MRKIVFISLFMLSMLCVVPFVGASTVYINSVGHNYADYNTAHAYSAVTGMNSTIVYAEWNCSDFHSVGAQPERNFCLWVNSSYYFESKIIQWSGNWEFDNAVFVNSVETHKVAYWNNDFGANSSQVRISFEMGRFSVDYGYNGTYQLNVWSYTVSGSWRITSASVGGASSSWSAGTSVIYVTNSSSVERLSLAIVPLVLIMTIMGAIGVSKKR